MEEITSFFGFELPFAVPAFAPWVILGVIVLIAVALVAWGFFKEVNKK